MASDYNLQRFVDAQETSYAMALAEIKSGRKRSHWIWFIFPQIKGLGYSETSKYYAINDIDEAQAYLAHRQLGPRLMEVCIELLKLDSDNATTVLGYPDDLKLKSSMTLFSALPEADPIFEAVLKKYFNGAKDPKTLQILKLL